MTNILELLDIIYYRQLDMPVKDIQNILQNGSRQQMHELLKNKRMEVEHKIRYEQLLLKKIKYIEAMYDNVNQDLGECSLAVFPSSYVLLQNSCDSETLYHQIPGLSKDQYVLSSLFHIYHIDQEEFSETKTIVLIEEDVVKELELVKEVEQHERMKECNCIRILKPMTKSALVREDFDPLLNYAEKHQLKTAQSIYVREIPLTSYLDTSSYYVELFLPILK